MNPVHDFFRRHAAVPADDAGPCWTKATEEALLAWFDDLAPIVRSGWNRSAGRPATHEERRANLSVYHEVLAEVTRRSNLPNASPAIVAAWFRSQLPASEGGAH